LGERKEKKAEECSEEEVHGADIVNDFQGLSISKTIAWTLNLSV
jgi:hypothetical protein